MKNLYLVIDNVPTKMDTDADICAHIKAQAKAAGFEVPDYTEEFNANKVIDSFASELDNVDWDALSEIDPAMLKLFKKTHALVVEAYAESDKSGKAAWDASQADAKLAKKEEKQAEIQKAAERQQSFAEFVAQGTKKADESFKLELESLQNDLPEGVTLTQNAWGGSQLMLADGTEHSDEALAAALGVMARKGDNSEFVKGVLQFMSGDAVNLAVAAKIYPDKKAAAKKISEDLAKLNINFVPRSLETNARMAERTPLELRNPRVDPSAYLIVCQAAAPKKKDFEKADDWKAAVEAHDADRLSLLTELSERKHVTTGPDGKKIEEQITSRADVKPLVDKMQIKHGLLIEKDPDERSAADWMKQYYFASAALELLVGVTEPGQAIFQLPSSPVSTGGSKPKGEKIELENEKTINILRVKAEELEELRDQAFEALKGIVFDAHGHTAAEYFAGESKAEVQVKVEVEGVLVVQKDPVTKKAKMKQVDIPCYYPYPFKS